MNKKIVLTGGGTLGHCIPHFAITPYLKDFTIYYIGSKNGLEKEYVKNKNIPYFSIPTVKFERNKKLKAVLIPFKLIKAINESKKILKNIKPNVVFSKGGYVGLPVTIAAKQLKIPVIIHESDKTLGLANKISSKYANKTLVAFSSALSQVNNGVLVGQPINEELFTISKQTALNYYNFKDNKPVLLITGGSLGSKIINENLLKILPELLKTFNVLHVVGKNNLTSDSFSGYKQFEFTDIKYAYGIADFAIARAGANSIFELIINKTPTLFIPLENSSSRGDQLENANYFYKDGLCEILREKDLNPKSLKTAIFNLFEKENEFKNNLRKNNITPANKTIADILNKY